MKDKSFLIGLVLSPIILFGMYWIGSSSDTKHPAATNEVVDILSLNFSPAIPIRAVTEMPFLQLTEKTEKKVSLKDFAGKPVILHFWATWCGACVAEMPELDEFAKQNGVHIIPIVAEENAQTKVAEYYSKKNIKNLKIFVDTKSALARWFGANALPTTIFINKSGFEVGRIIGPVDWSSSSAGQAILKYLTE
jgi:thiol-disulfide isomerase/thioredoxin